MAGAILAIRGLKALVTAGSGDNGQTNRGSASPWAPRITTARMSDLAVTMAFMSFTFAGRMDA
jgi:hypothetical protein